MSNEWTLQPGKPAMVIACCNVNSGEIMIEGCHRWIPASALRPLPPALIPEAQEVIEAAGIYADYVVRAASFSGGDLNEEARALVETTAAYRAAIAPKPVDPLTIATDALTKLAYLGNGNVPGNSEGNRLAQDALTAIAAARPAP